MRTIIKDALAILRQHFILFFILPLFIACGIFVYILKCQNQFSIINGAIESIGIFAAFMFTLIFVVVENFLKRKEKFNTNNDEDKRYLEVYRSFTQVSVALITFSILLAGLIIILQILFSQINTSNLIVRATVNASFSYFLVQYAVLIVLITKEMYAMLTEDIESKQ